MTISVPVSPRQDFLDDFLVQHPCKFVRRIVYKPKTISSTVSTSARYKQFGSLPFVDVHVTARALNDYTPEGLVIVIADHEYVHAQDAVDGVKLIDGSTLNPSMMTSYDATYKLQSFHRILGLIEVIESNAYASELESFVSKGRPQLLKDKRRNSEDMEWTLWRIKLMVKLQEGLERGSKLDRLVSETILRNVARVDRLGLR